VKRRAMEKQVCDVSPPIRVLSSNNPAPFPAAPSSAWFLRRARAAERWSPFPRPTVVSLVSFGEAQRRDLQRSRRRPHTAASLLLVLASHAVPESSRAIAARVVEGSLGLARQQDDEYHAQHHQKVHYKFHRTPPCTTRGKARIPAGESCRRAPLWTGPSRTARTMSGTAGAHK
jgi:hypothetical protein